MIITPDTKDWTWVLERPCSECGFDAAALERRQVGDRIRTCAERWSEVLQRPEGELRQRPAPDRWSALEYAAHVRDVYDLGDARLVLLLIHDDPTYPNWDQDATAVERDYQHEDPETVGAALVEAAARFAGRLDALDDAQWTRTGHRSDGAHFTVESFARYLVHDPEHHLTDVGAG